MLDLIRIASNLVTMAMVAAACYCAFDTSRSIDELKKKLDEPANRVDDVFEHDESEEPRV